MKPLKNNHKHFLMLQKVRLEKNFYTNVFGVALLIVILMGCSNYGFPDPDDIEYPGWGKSTTVAAAVSNFSATALDANGNVYAVGSQVGNGLFNYGNGVTATANALGGNALIVQYNAVSGKTQWANVVSATANSEFKSVAVDADGNIYAVGHQNGNGEFAYGNGIAVTAAYNGSGNGSNSVIVKYNNAGKTLWAKSTVGTGNSYFYGIVATNHKLFVVGKQTGTNVLTYGGDVSVQGAFSNENAVITTFEH